jgi:hypothetical protein
MQFQPHPNGFEEMKQILRDPREIVNKICIFQLFEKQEKTQQPKRVQNMASLSSVF